MSDVAAIAVLVFVAALLQVTLFSSLDVLGGTPDVLLLVLIGIALLRGSVVGAVAGFAGGLLLDVLTLDTLGVTSLLLALAGYGAAATARRPAATACTRRSLAVARRHRRSSRCAASPALPARRGGVRSARPPRGPAAGAGPEPDPRRARCSRSAAACCDRRGAAPGAGGAPPWLAGPPSASGARVAPLPAARSTGGGALPLTPQLACASACSAPSRSRIFAVLLPAAVGAPGALGRRAISRRPEQPGADAARRGPARLDPRPRRPADRRPTCPARPSSSGPPTCPRRAATRMVAASSRTLLDVPVCRRRRRRSRRARATR